MSFKQDRKLLLEQQRREQAWSARQAQKQMQFQKTMSSTAHTREVEDLRAAGLNPVLSANGQGASSPSGSMAEGSSIIPELAELIRASHSGGGSGGTKVIVQQQEPENENPYRPGFAPITSPHSTTSHSSRSVKPVFRALEERNRHLLKKDLGDIIENFRNKIDGVRVNLGGSARSGARATASSGANQLIDAIQAVGETAYNTGGAFGKYARRQYESAMKAIKYEVGKLPKDQQKDFWYDFYRG